MRNLLTGKSMKDKDKIFHDGFLYIISRTGEDLEEISIAEIILDAEYDEPMSLEDIARKYPDCRKLIYEDYLKGEVYNRKNHHGENEEAWELVGTTIGFA